MKPIATLALLSLSTLSLASNITNTKVSYMFKIDPITDKNESSLYVAEINDTSLKNVLAFRCDSGSVSVFLFSKNALMTPEQHESNSLPKIVWRVDNTMPETISTQAVTTSGKPNLSLVGFSGLYNLEIYDAFLHAKSKIVLRVLRKDVSPLTFIFSNKGFFQGFKNINFCK